MKFLKCFIFAIPLLYTLLSAQERVTNYRDIPSYLYPQFLRSSDPRSAAMGLTGVATGANAMIGYANPAGLSELTQHNVQYSYLEPHFIVSDGIFNQHTFAIASKFNAIAIGFSYFVMGWGKIAISTPENPTGTGAFDEPKTKQYQFTAASQFEITKAWSVHYGGNIKILNEDMPNEHTFWLFDVGMRIKFNRPKTKWSFGTNISNLGKDFEYKLSYSGIEQIVRQEPLRLFRTGIAIERPLGKTHLYTGTIEYQRNLNDQSFFKDTWNALNFGGEIVLFKNYFGRIGYVADLTGDKYPSQREGFTYGFGFEMPEAVTIVIPIRISCYYGRTIPFGMIDRNVFNVGISF